VKRNMVIGSIVLALCATFATHVAAQEAKSSFVYVPSTVSEQAKAVLQKMPDPSLQPAFPAANDIKAWKVAQAKQEAVGLQRGKPILERLQPTVTEIKLGGVPVVDVKPKNWKDNGKVMVYTHGGAYTFFSAKSSLGSSAVMANVTGLRVISVDYTLAPHAKWRQVTDQVASVFKALRKQGYAMKDIAIYGDSAGGSLAAGSVLKMRDQGMGMLAVVVLWTPWSDITDTGDTYNTLKHAEPLYVYDKHLKHAADAYADPKDQKNPYVSPVYGDYSKGFPPTLIQGGTKEIFLSNFIRQYQALDTAGQTVKLDLYEGMILVFQLNTAGSPESNTALKKAAAFVKQYLGG
jgi:monoterpene epsilon-lactone hydrolase